MLTNILAAIGTGILMFLGTLGLYSSPTITPSAPQTSTKSTQLLPPTQQPTAYATTQQPTSSVSQTRETTSGTNHNPNSAPAAPQVPSSYADALTSTTASGIASGGNTVDIYIYGPNNGNIAFNPNAESGSELVGPLVFSEMNVPVVSGRWSVAISPSLQRDSIDGWYYYQINIGHPMSDTQSEVVDSWNLTTNAAGNDNYDVLELK